MRANDEITCLLKLNRQEKRSRDADTLCLPALRVSSALLDLVRPKIFARKIALAIQKVVVMLANEHARGVDRIACRLRRVVENLQSRSVGPSQCSINWVLQQQRCRLSPFGITVVADQRLECLLGFVRCEDKMSDDKRVIAFLSRGRVGTNNIDAGTGAH